MTCEIELPLISLWSDDQSQNFLNLIASKITQGQKEAEQKWEGEAKEGRSWTQGKRRR